MTKRRKEGEGKENVCMGVCGGGGELPIIKNKKKYKNKENCVINIIYTNCSVSFGRKLNFHLNFK